MPEDYLSITYGDQERKLLMSFGLLNELMILVGDLPRVQVIGVDSELRPKILEAVFAVRGEKGEIKETISVAALPVPTADIMRVLTWVAEHVLDFFLGAVESAVKVAEPHQTRLTGLTPSGNGSAT